MQVYKTQSNNSNLNRCQKTVHTRLAYKDTRSGQNAPIGVHFIFSRVLPAFIFRYHGSVFGQRSVESVFIRYARPSVDL